MRAFEILTPGTFGEPFLIHLLSDGRLVLDVRPYMDLATETLHNAQVILYV
jgi:hypothetical protein